MYHYTVQHEGLRGAPSGDSMKRSASLVDDEAPAPPASAHHHAKCLQHVHARTHASLCAGASVLSWRVMPACLVRLGMCMHGGAYLPACSPACVCEPAKGRNTQTADGAGSVACSDACMRAPVHHLSAAAGKRDSWTRWFHCDLYSIFRSKCDAWVHVSHFDLKIEYRSRWNQRVQLEAPHGAGPSWGPAHLGAGEALWASKQKSFLTHHRHKYMRTHVLH